MIQNTQPPEKVEHHEDGMLQVHSVFHTIQGEGPFSGDPAVFVRLTGCNLQCPNCDTEYTSKRDRRSVTGLSLLVRDAFTGRGGDLVVITGGEPFRQNIAPFALALLDNGYRVQVETNGTLPPPPGLPMATAIIVSPKTGTVHPRTAARALAYKYVAAVSNMDPEDGLPMTALDHPAKPRLARPPRHLPKTRIYLQPVDDGNQHNTVHRDAVVARCLRHGYRLCLQTHKIIGVD